MMTTPQHSNHAIHSHHGRPGHGPAPEHDTADLAELLDLDAVFGQAFLAEAMDAASALLGVAPGSIVDLGAGPGSGSIALATRFPGSRIQSLDASPSMLERLSASASAAGVGGSVDTHLVDLDGDWPTVLPGAVDLAWAALSLHHVTDPGQVLRQTFEALRPGGVLVVSEMTGATAYDPADLGTGITGLGERIVAALASHGYPVTAEWSSALAENGFAPVVRHETTITASASASRSDGARYLALQLTRNRGLLSDDLSASDLAALDGAIDALETGTSDLTLSSGRAFWIAARPADRTNDADAGVSDDQGANR